MGKAKSEPFPGLRSPVKGVAGTTITGCWWSLCCWLWERSKGHGTGQAIHGYVTGTCWEAGDRCGEEAISRRQPPYCPGCTMVGRDRVSLYDSNYEGRKPGSHRQDFEIKSVSLDSN